MKNIVTIYLLLIFSMSCLAQTQISKQVMGSGATEANNANVSLKATAGQAVTGISTSASGKKLSAGFWYNVLEGSVSVIEITGTRPEHFQVGDIYPNPGAGEVFLPVDIDRSMPLHIQLVDFQGWELGILYNDDISPGKFEFSFNVSSYPSGIYFIVVNNGKGVVEKRLIRN